MVLLVQRYDSDPSGRTHSALSVSLPCGSEPVLWRVTVVFTEHGLESLSLPQQKSADQVFLVIV